MKKEIRVKGITDAGSRRAALLIMGLMFAGDKKSDTSVADPCAE
jgi:hypothetical protein